MADVKWIKITTDMFDNRKIKHLRRLPDGDSIVLIWVMLLTLAGRCNSGGMIFLTENIPYTPKMLADELDFEESTVQLALNALEQLGMIHTNGDGFLAVTGWEKHQNIEGMEKIRESKRLAQARWRAKKAALELSTVDTTVDTTEIENNNAEEEIEEESEEDKNLLTVSKDTVRSTDVLRIAEAWNDLSSLGIASIQKITPGTKRDEMLRKRIKDYGVDAIIKAIGNIRNSDFLQGKKKDFTITFDWFVKPNNFPKVLEGNYDNKKGGGNNGKYRQASSGNEEYGTYL